MVVLFFVFFLYESCEVLPESFDSSSYSCRETMEQDVS